MNQKNTEIVNKMNINSNAIIINQCNYNKYEEVINNNKKVKIYSFNEKGIGLSRNNALMRCNSEICLFADDDVIYSDKAEELILKEFKNNPKADIIIFNVTVTNKKRQEYVIKKRKKIRLYNCLRYSTIRIAAKTASIKKENVYFSLLFGGGSKYGSGEDSIFLYECIKKGLNVYSSPLVIGTVSHKTSTWFNGYNKKYFYDKGALFCALSKKLAKIYSYYFLIKNRKEVCKNINFKTAKKEMHKGIIEFINGSDKIEK